MKKFIVILVLCFVGNSFSLHAQMGKRTYVNQTEIGLMNYGFIPIQNSYSFLTMHGLKLTESWELGLSSGVEKYTADEYEKFWVLPFNVAGRFILNPHKRTTFYSGLDAGYGFAGLNSTADKVWNNTVTEKDRSFKGGLRFHPHVGWRWKVGAERTFISLSIGYQFQQIKLERSKLRPVFDGFLNNNLDNYYHERVTYNMGRAVVKVGMGF
ncbi:hypothetical protein [Sphingobacterium sp. CZ-2]|uniref:hypothetical protein n=1 Tax=Sphingobacterium sp. CZ-2 TaxID=2557994 RepID=UPI00106F99BE|nr:hypothetical protein [Sphingobacterium sp. CZ-2]QBR10944.1 hypothetical protein E3D81_01710 [Sphingobacterium sp. CZ-2]